jgi:lysophospholipase L1-like esterase
MKFLSSLLVALLVAAPVFAADNGSAKWEKEIAAFEASDKTNPPPKHALLFIGSSSIRLWDSLAKDFPDHKVINRGFGGSEIADSTYFVDRIVIPYDPAVIYMRAGTNDIANGKSPEQVFEDFKAFVAAVHAKLPKTEVVFTGVNPTNARWGQLDKQTKLNGLIKGWTEKTPGTGFIDCYDVSLGADGKPRKELFLDDQLHFNAEGYKVLAERIRPYLPKAE